MPDLMVKMLSLDETEFAPVVLKSYFFSAANYPPYQRLRPRYVFDYEFECITESDGAMIIDDKHYKIQKGDIVLRRPGQYTQGIMPYSCFAVFFDIKGTMGKDPDTYDMHQEQAYQPLFLNPVLDSIPVITHSSPERNYQQLFSEVLNETINSKAGSIIRCRALILDLLHNLYRDAMNPIRTLKALSGPHYYTIKKSLEYIELNQNKKIDLRELSSAAGLSPNYFHAVFTKAVGLTPNVYIIDLKMRRAKELLAGTDYTVAEISEHCGFENVPYFSYLFGKRTGCSPSEFRKKHSPRM